VVGTPTRRVKVQGVYSLTISDHDKTRKKNLEVPTALSERADQNLCKKKESQGASLINDGETPALKSGQRYRKKRRIN